MTVCINPPCGTVEVVEPNYEVDVTANVTVMPTYRGEYEITPTAEQQTLETDGLLMKRDVTVGAIPSNYGLITWNGTVITVS